MSNRVYQIIALVFLIGAPIIVHLVSTALPAVQEAAESSDGATSSNEVPAPTATPTHIPMPQNQPMQTTEHVGADPVFDVTPSLDPQGISPDASAEQSEFAAVPPPLPPRAAVQTQTTDDDVGPPPPRQPSYMDR